MIALIYFIGFFLVYYIVRYVAKKENDWTWSSVKVALAFAICSWLGALVLLGMFIHMLLDGEIKKDPPKWL
jgi:predicted permease